MVHTTAFVLTARCNTSTINSRHKNLLSVLQLSATYAINHFAHCIHALIYLFHLLHTMGKRGKSTNKVIKYSTCGTNGLQKKNPSIVPMNLHYSALLACPIGLQGSNCQGCVVPAQTPLGSRSVCKQTTYDCSSDHSSGR